MPRKKKKLTDAGRRAVECARDLLSDPKNWTRHEMARAANNIPVEPDDPHAVSWCALGAVQKCAGNKSVAIAACNALQFTARQIFSRGVTHVNDYIGREQVLQIFDKALEEK